MKKKYTQKYQRGFSAVELLITLFIAVLFLISGYQLYAMIIKDGGEARAQTSANNITTDYLQKYKNSATDPCTPQTLESDTPINNIPGLVNATVTVTIECPSLTATLSSSSQATGGSISYSGGYAIHTFNSSGTLQVTGSLSNADVLIVAGGVNGTGAAGNGGAGGRVTTLSGQTLTGSYTVTVGSAGAASSFGANTSSGTGAAGGIAGTGNGPPGAAGTASSITGATVYYGGGGGAGGGYTDAYANNHSGGSGGAGGGGAGGGSYCDTLNQWCWGVDGTNGQANTGGGGGGGGCGADDCGATGGNGGSGIVIVRYPSSSGVTTPIKSTSKIIVTVKYGNGQQSVITNSSYVTPSNLVTENQVLSLDAANIDSYPRTGTLWTDLSGKKNNGTLLNGVAFSTSNGGALSFDGTNDYVWVDPNPNLDFSTNGRFSFEAWINPSTVASGWIRGVIVQENYLNTGYRFGIINGGAPRFWTNQSGGTLSLTSSQSLTAGQWAHVAVTYDNQEAIIYVNGVNRGTSTGTYIAGSNAMRIGMTVQEYYSGLIGEVSYYSRALTANEVLQKFNTLKSRYGL